MTTITLPAIYDNGEIKLSESIKKIPARVFITLEYDEDLEEDVTIKLNKLTKDSNNKNYGPFETAEDAISFLNKDIGK